MLPTDPLTKEIFVPLRSNQKFASRKNQIKFNNLKQSKKRNSKKKYDRPLDKNRNILLSILSGQNEAIKSKDWLLALGYNFNIHTHYVRHNDKPIPCIFEFGLIRLENDRYKIIRNATN